MKNRDDCVMHDESGKYNRDENETILRAIQINFRARSYSTNDKREERYDCDMRFVRRHLN